MAELPYMQFYPADWLADTRMLTASAKGVWIDTLAALWNAPERGFLKRTERAWGRLWGVEPERVPQLLEELEDVASVWRDADGVTIASRRMIREEIERERSRNSKRPEERRDWSYRETVSRLLPGLLPEPSPKPPADLPEDSRRIPGERPEARNQSGKLHNHAPAKEPSQTGIPTLEEVKRYASSAPVPISPECAVAFHDTQEAEGWITRNGHPIADWRAALRRYASRWNEVEKSKRTSPAMHPGQPRHRVASGYGESTDISDL